MRAIFELIKRIERVEATQENVMRRQNNMIREGGVTKLDAAGAMAEVNADGLDTKPLPWLQRGGQQREWDPPTVGERVLILNPSGEPGRGLILPGGFSDKYKPNHDKGGEYKRSNGDKSHITQTADSITLTMGSSSITITDSEIIIKSPKISENP